jgi:hypothetical protein
MLLQHQQSLHLYEGKEHRSIGLARGSDEQSGVQHAAPIANRGNPFLGNGLGVMNNDAMGLFDTVDSGGFFFDQLYRPYGPSQ